MNLNPSPSDVARLRALAELRVADPSVAEALRASARLAAAIADVPYAWISFFHETHEIAAAAVGAPAAPRAMSGSAAALLGGAAASMQHPTGALPIDPPEPAAFCALTPIFAPEDLPLGVLGVAHTRPHGLVAAQQAALDALAASIPELLAANAERLRLSEDLEASRGNERQLAGFIARLQDTQAELRTTEVELSERNAELRMEAATDGLTGLRNYRAFYDELVRRFAGGERLALLLLDVDWFKDFNDAHGHPAGDDALRQVAELIAGNSSSADFVARYGGEEFAAILVARDAKTALDVAERIRRAIEDHAWPVRQITVSVGAAVSAGAAFGPEELVRRADQALYAAKRTGKNRSLAWSDA